MRYIFLLTLLFGTISHILAFELDSEYGVTFGLFGKIGVAFATFTTDEKTYKISIEANSNALAKALSNNRRERYESVGIVENGILVPTEFKKTVTQNHKGETSTYKFNHKNSEVFRERESYRVVSDFLSKKESIEKDSKLEKLEYYAKDDLLTLFFNLKHYIDEIKDDKKSEFFAVGANKSFGKVNITLLDDEKIKSFGKEYKGVKYFLNVVVNQKIFSSEKGELFIALDEDYLAKKAILKDVYIFGDIVGEMNKKVIREEK